MIVQSLLISRVINRYSWTPRLITFVRVSWLLRAASLRAATERGVSMTVYFACWSPPSGSGRVVVGGGTSGACMMGEVMGFPSGSWVVESRPEVRGCRRGPRPSGDGAGV